MSQQPSNPQAAGELPPLTRPADRREFLKWTGAGALVAVVAACDEATRTIVEVTPPLPVFTNVTLDFKDELGVLNYALLLEQLEAAFYVAVVESNTYPTTHSEGERVILEALLSHQVSHREFLKTVLGEDAIPEITADFSSVNLSSRMSILQAAQVLEEVGVAAYNGALVHLSSGEALASLSNIASVEGRHAATIRDLLSTTSFAPASVDHGLTPDAVLAVLDPYILNPVSLINLPA